MIHNVMITWLLFALPRLLCMLTPSIRNMWLCSQIIFARMRQRPFGKPPIFNICCLVFRVTVHLSATAEKGAFQVAFFSICQFAGLGLTLRQQPQFQVATFCRTRRCRLWRPAFAPAPPAPYSRRTLLELRQFAKPSGAVAECARVFCKSIFLARSLFTSGAREAAAWKLALSAFTTIVGASQALFSDEGSHP